MTKPIPLFSTATGNYLFNAPREKRFAEFDHGSQGKITHVFFSIGEREYRFTISASHEKGTPKFLSNKLYSVNAPLSLSEWRIPPHPLEDSAIPGWTCAYGLMEGNGLRICLVFLENGEYPLCLKFSAESSVYEQGYEVFELIVRSFSFSK